MGTASVPTLNHLKNVDLGHQNAPATLEVFLHIFSEQFYAYGVLRQCFFLEINEHWASIEMSLYDEQCCEVMLSAGLR